MSLCLSPEFVYELRQFDQIGVAEQRPPRRNRDEWIDAAGIRTTRQDRLQSPFGIVEIDSVLAGPRPSSCDSPQAQTRARIADGRDGLRGNVSSHRHHRVLLTTFSKR